MKFSDIQNIFSKLNGIEFGHFISCRFFLTHIIDIIDHKNIYIWIRIKVKNCCKHVIWKCYLRIRVFRNEASDIISDQFYSTSIKIRYEMFYFCP